MELDEQPRRTQAGRVVYLSTGGAAAVRRRAAASRHPLVFEAKLLGRHPHPAGAVVEPPSAHLGHQPPQAEGEGSRPPRSPARGRARTRPRSGSASAPGTKQEGRCPPLPPATPGRVRTEPTRRGVGRDPAPPRPPTPFARVDGAGWGVPSGLPPPPAGRVKKPMTGVGNPK